MIKPIFALLGLLCVGLGFAGIFLPVLPTTPFLLLAAWLFVKSSDRLYHWLLNHKILGPFVKTYREHRAISLKSKLVGLLLLWASMSYTVFFVVPLVWVKVFLIGVAVTISWVIIRIPTFRL